MAGGLRAAEGARRDLQHGNVLLVRGAGGRSPAFFPLLLTATALHALKARGRALWEKFDDGDNPLVKRTDLEAPTKSRAGGQACGGKFVTCRC